MRGDGYQVLEGLDLVSINAGRGHSCGLRADGVVGCWGSNTHGQTDAPAGRFTQVSTGADHICAVRADGVVVCWGSNDEGQTDAPSGRFTQVSAGAGYSCGVRADGAAVCWGAHLFSNLQVSGKRVTVSQAGQHSEKVNGRIVARRVADGRTEFGFQPEGEDRVLPRSRFFPANAGVNRWLQSSPLSVRRSRGWSDQRPPATRRPDRVRLVAGRWPTHSSSIALLFCECPCGPLAAQLSCDVGVGANISVHNPPTSRVRFLHRSIDRGYEVKIGSQQVAERRKGHVANRCQIPKGDQ